MVILANDFVDYSMERIRSLEICSKQGAVMVYRDFGFKYIGYFANYLYFFY